MISKYKFVARFKDIFGNEIYEWERRIGNDELAYYSVCYRNVDKFWSAE